LCASHQTIAPFSPRAFAASVGGSRVVRTATSVPAIEAGPIQLSVSGPNPAPGWAPYLGPPRVWSRTTWGEKKYTVAMLLVFGSKPPPERVPSMCAACVSWPFGTPLGSPS
jgi:hypothetical protein